MLVRYFTDPRHCSQQKNEIFCFLLTLNVKYTVHLGVNDIWLQLVESFSNLGLHFFVFYNGYGCLEALH